MHLLISARPQARKEAFEVEGEATGCPGDGKGRRSGKVQKAKGKSKKPKGKRAQTGFDFLLFIFYFCLMS
jgi:hypothetical protein